MHYTIASLSYFSTGTLKIAPKNMRNRPGTGNGPRQVFAVRRHILHFACVRLHHGNAAEGKTVRDREEKRSPPPVERSHFRKVILSASPSGPLKKTRPLQASRARAGEHISYLPQGRIFSADTRISELDQVQIAGQIDNRIFGLSRNCPKNRRGQLVQLQVQIWKRHGAFIERRPEK